MGRCAEGKVVYHYFNVPQWWIEQHEIKAPLEPVGTKYSGDEVFILVVKLVKKMRTRKKEKSDEDIASQV